MNVCDSSSLLQTWLDRPEYYKLITYFDSNGLSDGQANSLADLLAALAQASCATSAPTKSDHIRSLQTLRFRSVMEVDFVRFLPGFSENSIKVLMMLHLC